MVENLREQRSDSIKGGREIMVKRGRFSARLVKGDSSNNNNNSIRNVECNTAIDSCNLNSESGFYSRALIGERTVLGKRAKIGEHTIIGKRAIIGERRSHRDTGDNPYRSSSYVSPQWMPVICTDEIEVEDNLAPDQEHSDGEHGSRDEHLVHEVAQSTTAYTHAPTLTYSYNPAKPCITPRTSRSRRPLASGVPWSKIPRTNESKCPDNGGDFNKGGHLRNSAIEGDSTEDAYIDDINIRTGERTEETGGRSGQVRGSSEGDVPMRSDYVTAGASSKGERITPSRDAPIGEGGHAGHEPTQRGCVRGSRCFEDSNIAHPGAELSIHVGDDCFDDLDGTRLLPETRCPDRRLDRESSLNTMLSTTREERTGRMCCITHVESSIDSPSTTATTTTTTTTTSSSSSSCCRSSRILLDNNKPSLRPRSNACAKRETTYTAKRGSLLHDTISLIRRSSSVQAGCQSAPKRAKSHQRSVRSSSNRTRTTSTSSGLHCGLNSNIAGTSGVVAYLLLAVLTFAASTTSATTTTSPPYSSSSSSPSPSSTTSSPLPPSSVNGLGTAVTIRGAGASFPGEVYRIWMTDYRAFRRDHRNIIISYNEVSQRARGKVQPVYTYLGQSSRGLYD